MVSGFPCSTFLGSGPDRGRSPVEWGDFVRTSVHPSVRLSIHTYVRPSVPPLWAIQPGLRPSQPGLRPSQPGLRPSPPVLRPSQPGLRPGWLGLRLGWMAQRGGQTNVRTYGRTYKISPFYRTLSPIGVAALLPKGSSRPIKSRAREPLTI